MPVGRGPAGLSNQKRLRAPIYGGRDGKTLNNKEEKGQEKVGYTEKGSHSGVGAAILAVELLICCQR